VEKSDWKNEGAAKHFAPCVLESTGGEGQYRTIFEMFPLPLIGRLRLVLQKPAPMRAGQEGVPTEAQVASGFIRTAGGTRAAVSLVL